MRVKQKRKAEDLINRKVKQVDNGKQLDKQLRKKLISSLLPGERIVHKR